MMALRSSALRPDASDSSDSDWSDCSMNEAGLPGRTVSNGFHIPGIVRDHCISLYGWDHHFVEGALEGYRQFIELRSIYTGKLEVVLIPSFMVEAVWRQHISVCPQQYIQACKDYCGVILERLIRGCVNGRDKIIDLCWHELVIERIIWVFKDSPDVDYKSHNDAISTTVSHLKARYGSKGVDPGVWFYNELPLPKLTINESLYSVYQRDMAEREIRYLYSRSGFMLSKDLDSLLKEDVNKLLEECTENLSYWLSVHQPLIEESIRLSRQRSTLGVLDIRTYFEPLLGN